MENRPASRLQSIAAPGSVLVDDVTRRAYEAAIDGDPRGGGPVSARSKLHDATDRDGVRA
jgi:class 3 adenylate cyclase